MSIGDESRRENATLDALVMGHEDLFRTSPEFHAGVIVLARTLPRFMDLMAEDAQQAATLRKQIIDNLNTQTGPGL